MGISYRPVCLAIVLAATVPPALAGPPALEFVNRSGGEQIQNYSYGRGAAMVDLDGDGLLDLVTANAEVPNRVFRQRPGLDFVDTLQDWGIALDDRSTWGVLVADFDEDGDPDIYFINGGFIVPPVENQLLRNDLDTAGVFTDVSDAAGDAAGLARNFGGTTLDYDRDGDLDIFLTTTEVDDAAILLRNDGNLVFTDVSVEAGMLVRPYRHCSMGDFDNDGWPDIAAGVFDAGDGVATNVLYRNNGDGTFTDVAPAAGVGSPGVNFGMILEDFDNDGWQDIYLPKWNRLPAGPSELYMNNGDGTFTDVTAGTGIQSQADMGHTTGDLDADGYPDIYIGTGMPDAPLPDVMLRVEPDGAGGLLTEDVSESSGILSMGPTRCHGMAQGDVDGDGDVDVYTNNGGVPTGPPGSLEANALWENMGNDNNWTAITLMGTLSNRDAVGTRCVAYTTSGREIHRTRRIGHGFANTDSPALHFGIGADTAIDRIEITWPSGATQFVNDPPLGVTQLVVESVLPDCTGDLDDDNAVIFPDLLLLLADWGPCAGCAADLNGDGAVGFIDVNVMLTSWGACD